MRQLSTVVGAFTAAVSLLLSGCGTAVPERRADVDRLGEQLRSMPGVQSVDTDYADQPARGRVLFAAHVQIAADATTDQLAALTGAYLEALRAGKFRGYRSELDVRKGWNIFAVSSDDRPITNADQIIGQARDWISLRNTLIGATVTLRATVGHPAGSPPPRDMPISNRAEVELPENIHSVDIATAVGTIAARFPRLAVLDWTVGAAQQLNQIAFVRRFPAAKELDVWRALITDQSIPHADSLRINGPVTPPIWIAEATTTTDSAEVALDLAQRHLPVVAQLPAPVLYTASDQLSGHIGGFGTARGPVAVTIGGCTPRDPLVYKPKAAELALAQRYENCHR
jgi:hypothetical protein